MTLSLHLKSRPRCGTSWDATSRLAESPPTGRQHRVSRQQPTVARVAAASRPSRLLLLCVWFHFSGYEQGSHAGDAPAGPLGSSAVRPRDTAGGVRSGPQHSVGARAGAGAEAEEQSCG